MTSEPTQEQIHDQTNQSVNQHEQEKRFGCLQVSIILLLGMIFAVAVTLFVMKKYIFPDEFKPTVLNQKEEQVLEGKLARLESLEISDKNIDNIDLEIRDAESGELTPEAYSEEGASREVFFTEKELNSMLASNTEMARRVALDLADDLISAKVLIPVPEDFPVFAGKTLRGRAGLKVAFQDGRPIVILKGVSIMGVPVPNAWMGGIKNIDLIKEFGDEEGFWKSFAAGVEYIQVKEGQIQLKLKE